MKILIAEDDATSRMFMQKYLSRYGECDEAINGIEAINMVAAAIKSGEYYDLICLDVMMPKVDGIKALMNIRELEQKYSKTGIRLSKIIITSALNDTSTVEEVNDLGCHAYAWKPIDIQNFDEILKSLELI